MGQSVETLAIQRAVRRERVLMVGQMLTTTGTTLNILMGRRVPDDLWYPIIGLCILAAVVGVIMVLSVAVTGWKSARDPAVMIWRTSPAQKQYNRIVWVVIGCSVFSAVSVAGILAWLYPNGFSFLEALAAVLLVLMWVLVAASFLLPRQLPFDGLPVE